MLKFPSDYVLDHVSVSSLRTWLMCGYRWGYEYLAKHDKKDEPPGWDARLRGSAVDHAVTTHFKLKALDGVGLTADQCAQLAEAKHREGEDSHMFAVTEVTSRDRAARQASVYRRTFGEQFMPRAAEDVQKKLRFRTPKVHLPIVSVLDLITDTPMIVDTKVKKKPLGQLAVDRDFQLTTYAMATGVQSVALAQITDEDRPQAVFVGSVRTRQQIDAMADRYNQMIRGIQSRSLQPAPEGSWYCCAKWCPWWYECQHGANAGPNEAAQVVPGLDE